MTGPGAAPRRGVAVRDSVPADQPRLTTATVIGTGLVGTSVALALARHGVKVHLQDADPVAARTAAALGAGTTVMPPGPVDIAVLAVPPASVAPVLARAQAVGTAHFYTDVASVKRLPQEAMTALGCDLSTFIGGHPMAGLERSGPCSAQAGLFAGRPWILTPTATTAPRAELTVRALIDLCDAVPVVMTAEDHDRAMALLSHTPHLTSTLLAAALERRDGSAVRLAGQGLRDMVRIAGGDARLWSDILSANADQVAEVLTEIAGDLERTIAILRSLDLAGENSPAARDEATAALVDLLERGRRGHRSLPGKHGAPPQECTEVHVLIGDEAGSLARLLTQVHAAGVNVEDMSLDHALDRERGLVRLQVSPVAGAVLPGVLEEFGWEVDRVGARP